MWTRLAIKSKFPGVSGLPESNDALEPKYEQLEAAMISGDLERFGQIALDI